MPRIHRKRYLGIDPGTAHTGLAVISADDNGRRVRILHLEVVKTKKGELKESDRHRIIGDRVARVAKEYKVNAAVCEAFEIRPWMKMPKNSYSMSKLINAISESIYDAGIYFVLSSPDNKRKYTDEEMEKELGKQIAKKKVPYMVHAMDAIRHAVISARRVSRDDST